MKPTKENAQKALEYLEDQSVFLSEESFEFIKKFLKIAARKLPNEDQLEGVCGGTPSA